MSALARWWNRQARGARVAEVGRPRSSRGLALALAAALAPSAACVLPPPGPARPGAPPPPATLAEGQSAQAFQHQDASGGVVNYLVYLPRGYAEGGRRWPLILFLHGRSLRGNDPALVARYGLPRRLERDADFPFIVLSPQLREDERWTEFGPLIDLLGHAMERFPVDPERVYVTGYSMGGGGVWRIANAHPERFAAAAPLAGTRDEVPIKGLKDVPVWAFHGSDDESTPVGDSVDMVSRIEAAGGDARLTILPGKGHNIGEVYDDQELYDWFLAHRKFSPSSGAPRNANSPAP